MEKQPLALKIVFVIALVATVVNVAYFGTDFMRDSTLWQQGLYGRTLVAFMSAGFLGLAILLAVLLAHQVLKGSDTMPPKPTYVPLDFRRSEGPFDAVIGIVGTKAAGKGALVSFLLSRGFRSRRVSDEIRIQAATHGLANPTVKQLQEIGNEFRSSLGGGYWATRTLRVCAHGGIRLVVIDGIRNPAEIDALQTEAGDAFILVGVDGPYEFREKNFISRRQAGDECTPEGFAELDATDRGRGQPETGQQTDACMALVCPDNIYYNDGTLADFHLWADDLLFRHGLKKFDK